jgi:hypothetical protein
MLGGLRLYADLQVGSENSDEHVDDERREQNQNAQLLGVRGHRSGSGRVVNGQQKR